MADPEGHVPDGRGAESSRREVCGVCDDPRVQDVTIRGDMIRLGQLLKLAGVVDSGGEAKAALQEGLVTVNGEVDVRRGRQLHDGDVVVLGDDELRIVAAN
jgi:ribosome-associated protein